MRKVMNVNDMRAANAATMNSFIHDQLWNRFRSKGLSAQVDIFDFLDGKNCFQDRFCELRDWMMTEESTRQAFEMKVIKIMSILYKQFERKKK